MWRFEVVARHGVEPSSTSQNICSGMRSRSAIECELVDLLPAQR
jgi:hypothetical protein